MAAESEPQHLDGNAVAGIFDEAFGIEVSIVTVTCDTCHRPGRFADNKVYARGPGVIARCPRCNEITARIVRTPTDMWLDLRGSRSWRIPLSTQN